MLRSEPPVDGATLNGWVALSEWAVPGGEPMLVLMGRPEASLLQMKAYLHSGILNMVWRVYGDAAALHRTETLRRRFRVAIQCR